MRNIILSTLTAGLLLFSGSNFAAESIIGGNEGQKVYQCTSTCDPVAEAPEAPNGPFGNPSLVTPEDIAELSKPTMVADASNPYAPAKPATDLIDVNTLIANQNGGGGELLAGVELAGTTGFDFEAECNAYTGPIWQWRESKCLEMDPQWKSPGLGKTLPNAGKAN